MEYHEHELIKFYNSALDAANKKLKLISGITRYDIMSQLTVLQLYHEMLEKKLPDSSCQEYFKKLGIATDRISSIMQFTQKYEEIGVNTPVWMNIISIVDAAKKDEIAGNLRLVNDLPAGIEVFSDALIVYVIYNLMDNAVRYGGKITTIRLSLRESGDDPVIVFEDDGDGIPADEKEKIFGHVTGKNTGFGLFLSREVLAITGITITENGEPGRGARFEITVPKGVFRSAGTVHDLSVHT